MTQFHLTCRLNLKNTQVLRTICAPPANRAASNTIQPITRVLNLWKIWTRKMLNKELCNFGTLSPPAPRSTNGSFCQIFYPHAEQEWWWCLPPVLVFKSQNDWHWPAGGAHHHLHHAPLSPHPPLLRLRRVVPTGPHNNCYTFIFIWVGPGLLRPLQLDSEYL